MDKKQSQSGFAHLLISIAMAVVLIGALGFVYWQNFMQTKSLVEIFNPASTTKVIDKVDEAEASLYNTYTTDKYGISFKHPSVWSIDDRGYEDKWGYYPYVKLKNANGEDVAVFRIDFQGGGTCSTASKYTAIDSEETEYQSVYQDNGSRIVESVVFSFIVIKNESGLYETYYGLTDKFKSTGEWCSYSYMFRPDINGGISLSFFGGKLFSNIDDAKEYIKSDEYKEIKKMILSLSY